MGRGTSIRTRTSTRRSRQCALFRWRRLRPGLPCASGGRAGSEGWQKARPDPDVYGCRLRLGPPWASGGCADSEGRQKARPGPQTPHRLVQRLTHGRTKLVDTHSQEHFLDGVWNASNEGRQKARPDPDVYLLCLIQKSGRAPASPLWRFHQTWLLHGDSLNKLAQLLLLRNEERSLLHLFIKL